MNEVEKSAEIGVTFKTVHMSKIQFENAAAICVFQISGIVYETNKAWDIGITILQGSNSKFRNKYLSQTNTHSHGGSKINKSSVSACATRRWPRPLAVCALRMVHIDLSRSRNQHPPEFQTEKRWLRRRQRAAVQLGALLVLWQVKIRACGPPSSVSGRAWTCWIEIV